MTVCHVFTSLMTLGAVLVEALWAEDELWVACSALALKSRKGDLKQSHPTQSPISHLEMGSASLRMFSHSLTANSGRCSKKRSWQVFETEVGEMEKTFLTQADGRRWLWDNWKDFMVKAIKADLSSHRPLAGLLLMAMEKLHSLEPREGQWSL